MKIFVPVLVSLNLVTPAQAKLLPVLTPPAAKPGESVQVDLGDGAEAFPAPLRIYLAPLDVADTVARESDPRLTPVATLGTPGEYDVPRFFVFRVPDLKPGRYGVQVWFDGYATDRPADALIGIHPVFTILPSSPAATRPSEASPSPTRKDRLPGFVAPLVAVAAFATVFLALWLIRKRAQLFVRFRAGRRAPTGVGADG